MDKALSKELVVSSLNTTNADENGYEYMDDFLNPFTAINEILEMAKEKGYKFGSPGDLSKKDLYYGLYRPKKKKPKYVKENKT